MCLEYSGMTKISVEELEVADAAHFMGYELMRGREGMCWPGSSATTVKS